MYTRVTLYPWIINLLWWEVLKSMMTCNIIWKPYSGRECERECTTNWNYFIRIFQKYKIRTNHVEKCVIKESHSSPVIWHIYVTLFYPHIFVFTLSNIFFIIFYRDAFLFGFIIIVWTITLCLLVTLSDASVCGGWRSFSKRSDKRKDLLDQFTFCQNCSHFFVLCNNLNDY